MTAQRCENLIVEHPKIDFGNLFLYGVLVGDNVLDFKNRSRYKFNTEGDESKFTMCTALWRGYVSTFILDSDGAMTLVKLEYPFTKGSEPDAANERLSGDFWLDMRPSFFGGSLFIPFENGHILLDKSKWVRRERA